MSSMLAELACSSLVPVALLCLQVSSELVSLKQVSLEQLSLELVFLERVSLERVSLEEVAVGLLSVVGRVG